MPIGILMKKTQRQLQTDKIAPPRIGPTLFAPAPALPADPPVNTLQRAYVKTGALVLRAPSAFRALVKERNKLRSVGHRHGVAGSLGPWPAGLHFFVVKSGQNVVYLETRF